jgi:hypothetical protein|tara:strand:- start:526 stop:984 length:459 start_codon:yes stop_codon:yes gene_type:complete
MRYPNESFYVVNKFGLGKKGFGIGLDHDFAKRFYDREITPKQVNDLNRYGKRVVRDIFEFKKESFSGDHYFFLRNDEGNPTLLLQWCSVIGSGHDLVIDGNKLNKIRTWDEDVMNSLIGYRSHNIDTTFQATSLFRLWREWATMAHRIIKED